MTAFQSGEIVDITIKGVRMGERSHIRVTIEDEGGELWVLPPQAAIERVVPANWPPRVNDLWRGRTTVWFVMQDRVGNALMTDRSGGRHGPEYVAQQDSPLTLVHREDKQDPFFLNDDPKTWTDFYGKVWDLTAKYTDCAGNTWHYAGGFGDEHGTGMEPLLSRDDWTIQDKRFSDVWLKWGALTPVRPEQDGSGS